MTSFRRRPVFSLLAATAAILPLLAVGAPAHAVSSVVGDGVRINEVESDGGTPGDWIELVNTGGAPVDVSGWVVKDNEDSSASKLPAATTIPAGGHLVLEKPTISFGLGKDDQARLYLADGTTLVDSYSWTAHASTSYGRCADGTGEFAVTVTTTKGAANDCEPDAAEYLRLNEVESNGGTPGDWVELVNIGEFELDAAGLVIRDNDDSHALTVPADTIVPAHGYLAVDTESAFGLGGKDSARLFDTDGTTLIDQTSWTSHAATSYGRCPDVIGAFEATRSTTKGAANDCEPPVAADIRVNEVESSGGAPGDWAELFNPGADAADVSGWIVKDSADDHVAVLPGGSTIAAGGFLVVEESVLGYGLGAADSVRLLLPDSVTVVDSYSWTAHAATSYGRCPDGTGEFALTAATTKGASNDCADVAPGGPGTPADAWPGGSEVSTVDTAGVFNGNMSGLTFEPADTTDAEASDTLWAVKNGPGTLFRLHDSDGVWAPDSGDWANGKALRYADGTGDVDAEGVALTDAGAAGGIFVSSERNNAANGVSRPSILRFDAGASGTTLSATAEWNIAADLPTIAPNSGLEAIAWVPDVWLVERGLVDASTGTAYDPADYAGHGNGLFFVGLEANGMVYAYALDLTGTVYHRVAAFASGFPGVMDLEFEAETELLWAVCDDTCDGRTATLDVAQSGAAAGTFAVTALYERPTGMPNLNNEGFAIAPQERCTDGSKPVIYADDAATGGHALRAGTIDCVASGEPGTPVTPAEESLTDGARGSITVPGTVRAGATITVVVGAQLAGDTLDAWLFSTPVHLGTVTVSPDGTIRVTIPADTAAGAHRLAVLSADGTLLGWDDLTVTAAGTGGAGTGTASAGTGAAALASTGATVAPLVIAASLALLLGALALVIRARRRAS
ncbi:lamin tail domain-containing protein [Agromyces badenianii]|uniref:lamin tail domain-containing protein n=1 Tax=Agromyces badenianii TaxID=2080742 RepID=UPI000D5A110E|nr:lamin tail domain-containing protein [Agromyces badenianii]PWC05153.1 cell wall protein [Agromyces badenianii]